MSKFFSTSEDTRIQIIFGKHIEINKMSFKVLSICVEIQIIF